MTTFTKLALTTAALLLFQIITYFGSEKFQHDPHNVLTFMDDHIPFIPWTVLIYVLWFPLIALFPLALFYEDIPEYAVYISAMFTDIVVSVIIYLIYPTSFVRPQVPDTLMGRCMQMVYKGSYRGLNCAPSLHCSSCMLIILSCVLSVSLDPILRILCTLVSLGIIISTMTTKQHAFIDFASAIPMAALTYVFGHYFPAATLADWILK